AQRENFSTPSDASGIKAGARSNGVVGPTSQIPGLSPSADDSAPVERHSGRRVGIFETDSDYVKLAKQGGQKGLLSHDVDVEAKPKTPYNPPAWFGGTENSKAMSPDGQQRAARQPLAAPFGTDNCSSWERETDSFSQGKEKVNGPGRSHHVDFLHHFMIQLSFCPSASFFSLFFFFCLIII
uniref:Uncharacterized protein n=1 Tax=Myripristis murdjan TaxID=586833 RepID=A0A668A6D0_9TELE